MIVFTSGTTGKPKGVVMTHKAIHAQIAALIEAWQWSETDVIPLFLPLHHMHGIINVLSCALWCGATVHAMPKLDLATALRAGRPRNLQRFHGGADYLRESCIAYLKATRSRQSARGGLRGL